MPDRILKLRDLRRILRSFDCWEESARGKGGHTMFFRVINSQKFSYPVPGRDDVLACYVRGARRKFHLTAEAPGLVSKVSKHRPQSRTKRK